MNGLLVANNERRGVAEMHARVQHSTRVPTVTRLEPLMVEWSERVRRFGLLPLLPRVSHAVSGDGLPYGVRTRIIVLVASVCSAGPFFGTP